MIDTSNFKRDLFSMDRTEKINHFFSILVDRNFKVASVLNTILY